MSPASRRTVVRAVTGLVLATLLAPATASAQPPAPTVQQLAVARLDDLPAPPAFIRLVRITLQPGASVATHSHPGPEIVVVESGQLEISADRPPAISGAAAAAGDDGSGDVLGTGDRVGFPAGTTFSFGNPGQAPAVVLALVVLPAGPDRPAGATVQATPEGGDAGVRSQPLGDAVAPGWPAAPVNLVVERIALGPGAAIPAAAGPALVSVERGVFAFSLRGGEYEVSLSGGPPRPRSGDGAAERLAPGDAAFFPGGVNALPRAASDGDLILLRVVLTSGPGGTPEPTASTPVAGATPVGRFSTGDSVVLTEDGVRLRAAPSTDGAVVGEFPAGTVFVITGSPVSGDGAMWYPVSDESGDASGFVADAFLSAED